MTALFDRMIQVLKSEVHGALDRIENPEHMVEQAFREREEDLQRAQQHLQNVLAQKLRQEDELKTEQQAQEHWEERATHALTHGKEDLARQALEAGMNHKARAMRLEESIKALTDEITRLKEVSESMQNQYVAMEQRKDAILSALRTQSVLDMADDFGSGPDSPIQRFNRMANKATNGDYQAQAAQQLNEEAEKRERDEEKLKQEFQDLEKDSDGVSKNVKDKLAAMKARLQS